MTATETLHIILDESRLETGLWCERCRLPSGWSAPLLTLTANGVGQLGTIARCLDGNHPLHEEAA